MSQLQCFENSMFGRVRVIERDGEPWFVAKDVCECLGLDQVSRACDRLDEDERGLLKVTHPQNPDKTLEVCGVSESGLYALILRSNKPDAKAFRKWVTAEVIPSIRKTGGYGIRSVEDMINNPDTAIQLLTQVKILRLQNEQLAIERDTAIKTKAWIGSRREATAMNTASQKSKECERLREQLGDAEPGNRSRPSAGCRNTSRYLKGFMVRLRTSSKTFARKMAGSVAIFPTQNTEQSKHIR